MSSVRIRTDDSNNGDRHKEGRPRSARPGNNLKTLLSVVALVTALIIVMIIGWLVTGHSGLNGRVEKDKYQAVFLTNGQVYFGKLHVIGDDYIKLTDIFYLQSSDNKQGAANPQEADKQDSSNLQLIKLGSEVHGPEDEMIIKEDKILFFENLKSNGNVASSIRQYHERQ